MKKLLLLLAILPLIISCNGQSNSNYIYSEKETQQFLNEITKNAVVSITDITEMRNEPSDEFGIITKYPLSKEEVDEYNKNKGTIVNSDGKIDHFTTYKLKNYELRNEKNEELQFVDNFRSKTLKGLPLGEYENVLYKNLGILFTLNKKFEKLNGFIAIEFEMPNGMEKEIKIPVNITINDKVPE